MPRLPRLRGRELNLGAEPCWLRCASDKRHHHFLKHPHGRRTVVPVHAGETIGPGLVSKILKDVEMDAEEFGRLL
jgi:predicted RNA binding protein YcfA (HicA-like mRNA interferase family)